MPKSTLIISILGPASDDSVAGNDIKNRHWFQCSLTFLDTATLHVHVSKRAPNTYIRFKPRQNEVTMNLLAKGENF
ncbi:hypothetical protein IEQ34_012844 [Dendrobium chrysotoxum]|uniref:Uncharacterized protein n=1 Tax=Dendrobium chrysotoxum TaxID=161865 RepID=A0AAV7G6S4_DENCH|nr:hypothetical protein IEQ34_012844 [Dendrobium chrysotoxum]